MSRKLYLNHREYLLSRVNPKIIEHELKGDRKKFLSKSQTDTN